MIEAVGIRKVYRSGSGKAFALRGIDLRIETSSFVAVMGPSGSGKSSLLHVLGLLALADSGSVRLDGRPTEGLREGERDALRLRKIGFVFQAYNLIEDLTAIENLILGPALAGAPRRETRSKARDLLGRVGLRGKEGSFPNELSGGEQQRVAVARALIHSPSAVFLDEPTGALDSASGEGLLKLLCEVRRETGATMVMATHDEGCASRSDRIVRMADGSIVSGGQPC